MARVFFDTRINIDSDALSNTTTYVVLQSDSGKTFMVSGGTQTVTLPPVADLQKGWNCKFVNAASPSGDKTLGAGSTIIHGISNDAGNGIAAGSDGTAKTSIVIEAAGKEGDTLNLFTDGALYYFDASSAVNDGFTTA